MKNRLAALGRLAAIFILAILLLIALSVLSQEGGGRQFGMVAATAFLALRRILPLAATLALFLGANAFKTRGRLGPIGFVLLLVAGYALVAGGFALRRFGPDPGSAEGRDITIRSGAIQDLPDGCLFVGKTENGKAFDVLAWRASAGKAPRLSWQGEAELDLAHDSITIHGTSLALRDRRDSLRPSGLFARIQESFDDRLSAIDSLGPGEAALTLAAFTFLAASLAGLAGLARWPLAGFFLSMSFLAGLWAVDLLLAGSGAIGLYLDLSGKLGLGTVPAGWLAPGLEAILALVLAILVLTARRKEEA